MYGVKTNVCRVLVGKSEGKRAFGTPRDRGWEELRMDLREIGCGEGWGHMELIEVTQRQVVGSGESGNEPSGSKKCGKFLY
jgi:hypothetical protein